MGVWGGVGGCWGLGGPRFTGHIGDRVAYGALELGCRVGECQKRRARRAPNLHLRGGDGGQHRHRD